MGMIASPDANGSTGAYDSVLSSLPSVSSFASGQNGMVNGAYDKYLTTAQNQPKLLDTYNSLESAAGIPALRTTANTLRGQVDDMNNAIENVEPTVNATTQNSLVTEGQRTGMVNAQKYPLNQQLIPLTRNLGNIETGITNAEAGINQKVGYMGQDNQNALTPLSMGITVAQDNAARNMTGYTTDLQNQLDVTLKKLARGEAISDEEKAAAAAAAQKEQDYKNQLSLQQDKQANQYKSLGKYGIYDSNTGTIIGGTAGGGGGGGFQVGGDSLGLFG